MNIVGTIIAAVAGAGAAYWAIKPFFYSRVREFNREIGRMPKLTLVEVSEGIRARFVGRAEPLDEVLEAPISGRRCLYYTATISAVNDGRFHTVAREDRAVIFVLDDSTARAIVDPSRSQVTLDWDANTRSGTFDSPTEREQAFLDRLQVRSTSFGGLFNLSLRYDEAIIEVGETIAIVGEVVREPDPDAPPEPSYRGEQPTQLRMTSSRKRPMIISDKSAAKKA